MISTQNCLRLTVSKGDRSVIEIYGRCIMEFGVYGYVLPNSVKENVPVFSNSSALEEMVLEGRL